ncbi:hypothetical protein A3850_012245 [Lewinella sp. 4G2]|nr:hypothetical protein A3850_012245 [Lewinella sp. 4G2]
MSRRPFVALMLLILICLGSTDLMAQRNRSTKGNSETWPPTRGYGRTTLGHSLQQVFHRHYDVCGFGKAEGKRDYTPPSIENFLGKRSLRSHVEEANVNGGNLLNYVFSAEEVQVRFDAIQFRPDHLLFTTSTGVDLNPQPRPGFDAFVLTKNCGGYLKASIDAGFKPPYVSLTAALEADDQRNSTVVAVAGSFISPLTEILAANDERTTELLMELWQFYAGNPQFEGQAYYLAGFDGLLVKHLTEAGSIRQLERGIGANVSLPLAGHLGGDLTITKSNEEEFSGTDWQTLVFSDFNTQYRREDLFAPLPTAGAIRRYFAKRSIAEVSNATVEAVRTGAPHRFQFELPGLPANLAGASWRVQDIDGSCYESVSDLKVFCKPDRTGLVVEMTAAVNGDQFTNPLVSGVEVVPANFTMVLPNQGGLPSLGFPVEVQLPVTQHPLLQALPSRFELQRENNGAYALRWHLHYAVTDDLNPIDADEGMRVTAVNLGEPGDAIAVRAISAEIDERRGLVEVVLQTYGSWPLDRIDDSTMPSQPVRLELEFSVAGGNHRVRRQLTAEVAMPNLLELATDE